MVTDSGPLLALTRNSPARQLLQPIEQFQDRGRVLTAAPQVVNLSRSRVVVERLECPDHVFAVNLVANLLALVTDDRVGLALDRDADQIGQEAMELNGAVEWPRQAAAPEDPGLQSEVAAVLLGHDVAGQLADAEETVQTAIDPAGLGDPLAVVTVSSASASWPATSWPKST